MKTILLFKSGPYWTMREIIDFDNTRKNKFTRLPLKIQTFDEIKKFVRNLMGHEPFKIIWG